MEDRLQCDILAAILECSILSSKIILCLTDSGTFDLAYDDLAYASEALLQYRPRCVDESYENRIRDLQRCLSGAFWNQGSQLYQAARWDHAVPFITRSVDIDRNLLQNSVGEREDPLWKQFFEQMPKRLLVLGNSFSKMGNRRVTNSLILHYAFLIYI